MRVKEQNNKTETPLLSYPIETSIFTQCESKGQRT